MTRLLSAKPLVAAALAFGALAAASAAHARSDVQFSIGINAPLHTFRPEELARARGLRPGSIQVTDSGVRMELVPASP